MDGQMIEPSAFMGGAGPIDMRHQGDISHAQQRYTHTAPPRFTALVTHSAIRI